MQRVLVIDNEMLLGAAVQTLLAGQADLDVVGLSLTNQEALAQEIDRLQPDVIVLDEFTSLDCPAELLSLWNDCPKLRIVVVSANHDLVRIFNKRETELSRAADLFDIIRGRSVNDRAL